MVNSITPSVVTISGMSQVAELTKTSSTTCSNSLATMTLSTREVNRFRTVPTMGKKTAFMEKVLKTLKRAMPQVAKARGKMMKESRST